jgi:hypothetical protein
MLCDAATPAAAILNHFNGAYVRGKSLEQQQRKFDIMQSMLQSDAQFIYVSRGTDGHERDGTVVFYVDSTATLKASEHIDEMGTRVSYDIYAIDYANARRFESVGTVEYVLFGSEPWHSESKKASESSWGFLMLNGRIWGRITTKKYIHSANGSGTLRPDVYKTSVDYHASGPIGTSEWISSSPGEIFFDVSGDHPAVAHAMARICIQQRVRIMASRLHPRLAICDVNTSPPLLQPEPKTLRIKMPRGKVLEMSVEDSTTVANVR